MVIPLLIMNVQVFSLSMDIRYLTSREGILQCNGYTMIKVPLCAASLLNGGPVVGERYYVRYLDGIVQDLYPPEFCYVGVEDQQLMFLIAQPQTTKPGCLPQARRETP
jgi:hypothetical protein